MNARNGKQAPKVRTRFRCAIYTRKSTEDGLEQEFNSLDAQRESGEAFIKSQTHDGWECVPDHYDDGGFTGGNMERPALKRLMADIEAGKVDCVVVYKVDRLSRSLLDFARMMETFEKYKVSFVSVTQQFNTASSMGRLVLNVLLSFAQFEREMISERTRDKIAAARRKGKWVGGMPILGYEVVKSKLVVLPEEAERVRQIFKMYVDGDGLTWLANQLAQLGWRNKAWTTSKGTVRGGRAFDKTNIYKLLTNVAYIGRVTYKEEIHPGEHEAIVSDDLWRKVQSKLEFQRRTGGAMCRNKFGAVLKGLLHCVPCKCAMSPSSSISGTKRYRYYICTTAQKRGWHTCPSRAVPAAELERFVVGQIKWIGNDPLVIAETVRQAREQTTDRLASIANEERLIERELAGYHGELKRLAGEQADRENVDLAAARLVDLQERIASAERRLTEVRSEAESLNRDLLNETDVAKALAHFEAIWDSLNFREQGRLLALLIDRIDYDGENGTISITFRPNGFTTLNNQAGDVA